MVWLRDVLGVGGLFFFVVVLWVSCGPGNLRDCIFVCGGCMVGQYLVLGERCDWFVFACIYV